MGNPLTTVYYVNIDLRLQFGFSVAEAHRKVPNGDEQGEKAVFAGY